MAEGGGEEDQNNPFSFKTYVKKKTKQPDEQDIDTDDIFAVTGAAVSRKKEKQSLVVTDDSDDAAHPSKAKKKGKKENPFSFKKFIGQSGQKESDSSQCKSPPVDSSSKGSAPAAVSAPDLSHAVPPASANSGSRLTHHAVVPPDFASDLPDFIQNHFSEDHLRLEHERRQLPDFALQSRIPHDGESRLGEEGSAPLVVFGPGQEESLADTSFSDEEDGDARRSRQLILPDFLVDGAISGVAMGGDGSEDVAGIGNQREPSRSRLPELPPLDDAVDGSRSRNGSDAATSGDATVMQLREENRRLQATISQMQQRARDEETRVVGLEKEIARLRKKEAEETLVMEQAVQQVEQNLVATTTRAVQAETLVTKLKQDVKALQGQVKALAAENEALFSGDRGLSDIRERTKYASEQLATAAAAAEHNLKELLGGVEKLKLLGHVLSSLEKVTDADNSPTHENSPKMSPT